MKTKTILSAGLCLLTLSLSSTAFAGKKNKKNGADAQPGSSQAVLKDFDKNLNGSIDGEEVEALQKAFADNASLKALDTNQDGKLEENEISAIKPAPPVEKKKKKNK